MRVTSLQHQAAAEDALYFGELTPAAIRVACGFQQKTIANGVGVTKLTVWRWENGKRAPRGISGAKYQKVMAGLARHLEIREESA